MRPNGRAGVIVPEGIIFQSGSAYRQLRKLLIENGLYAVVSLPAGLFQPYSGVKTSIFFIDKKFRNSDEQILFVDVKNTGISLGATNAPIKENDIPSAIADINDFKQGKDKLLISWIGNKKSIYTKKYDLSAGKYKQISNLDKNIRVASLKEIASLVKGKSSSTKTPTGSYPLYLTAEERKTSDHYDFNGDGVAVPLISALGHGKAAIKRIHRVKGKFALANLLVFVEPNRDVVDPNFLFFVLSYKKDDIAKLMKGAANVSMKVEDLENFQIPIPSIEAQKELVKQIDSYQQIINGASQVIKSWKPSIVIDQDWENIELGEICFVKGGKRIPKAKSFSPHITDYPYIRVADLKNGSVDMNSLRYISKEVYEEIKRYTISSEDVYITIAGTIGLTGIIPQDLDNKNLTENAAKLVIKDKSILSHKFLAIILQSDQSQQQIKAQTIGAGVPKLGLERIASIQIPIPPINFQLELVEQIQRDREILKANEEIIKEYEAKIQGLISDLFVGKTRRSHLSSQITLIKHLQDEFDSIESEVIRMMGNKQIFEEIINISKKNSQINQGNSFWDFLKESYVALMVSAVCRQVDTDERSASLINLLGTILYNPSVIQSLNKDWYSSQYHREDDILPGFMEGMGEEDFKEHFGTKEYVDPAIVYMDLKKLEEDTKEIKKYRNKRVAHRDKKEQLFKANYDDLHKAVETVRSITSKYYLLLKQGGNDLIPIDQTDWQKILTVPWINKKDEN